MTRLETSELVRLDRFTGCAGGAPRREEGMARNLDISGRALPWQSLTVSEIATVVSSTMAGKMGTAFSPPRIFSFDPELLRNESRIPTSRSP